VYSVRGDYAYLALRVTGDSYGSIVDGYDIDLMEVSDVAPTFAEFVLTRAFRRWRTFLLDGMLGDDLRMNVGNAVSLDLKALRAAGVDSFESARVS
jgi:hypothetical protein